LQRRLFLLFLYYFRGSYLIFNRSCRFLFFWQGLPRGLEFRGDGETLSVRDRGEAISNSLIGMNFSMSSGVPLEIARLTIESRVALFKG
jgi:hypothetical protein